MKIQIITSRYPTEKEPYNHMFVHTRNIEYLKHGHNVEIYVPSKTSYNYSINNIQVYTMPVQDIVNKIQADSLVMIHLLYHSLINQLDGGVIYNFLISQDKPTLFFIHGIETQKIWRSRKEDIELTKPKSIARFIYRDFYLIKKMKQVFQDIMNNTTNIRFVTVSKWMQQDAEETLGININTKVTIIPNGIDISEFETMPNKFSAKRALKLSKDKRYILFLSRIQHLNQVQAKFNITDRKTCLFASLTLINIDHLLRCITSKLTD